MRKIALEEHFVTEELAHYGASTAGVAQPGVWAEASRRLLDVSGARIAEMDAAGIDVQVLSLNSPGIQAEPDPAVATAAASSVNDFLAGVVAEHPTRFAGFAALALQDGKAAARELERAVSELGLKGALVNAHTQGRYLDDPDLRVVWEQAEGLDVPLYLHPGNSYDTPHVLSGHPELIGPMWSWGPDTATHALRLVFGGVLDDFPRAKLLLGHMGEGLPFGLWRLDSRWSFHNHHGVELALEQPSAYLRRNFFVTTSGVCSDAPFLCSLLAMGADRMLFSTDYPFESMNVASEYLDRAPMSEPDRAKIAHRNAETLLRIPPVG
ncbi:MAG: amidohydrolase family protein [Acidimicrobiales bacterium]